tara:strand:+ start:48 stop:482 length:435 start_codon:yes stop_codon:yes gene_type:complete
MSLSKKSPKRQEKEKNRKLRRERGEAGYQKAALFIKNKLYGGKGATETSGIGRKLIDKAATSTAKKQANAGKKKKITPLKDLKGSMRERRAAQNTERFGTKAMKGLKAKGADFKKMKKGELTKAQFIKRYPNSITAQRAAGKRK